MWGKRRAEDEFVARAHRERWADRLYRAIEWRLGHGHRAVSPGEIVEFVRHWEDEENTQRRNISNMWSRVDSIQQCPDSWVRSDPWQRDGWAQDTWNRDTWNR